MSVIGSNVLAGASGQAGDAGGYQIQRSLRFNSSDSAYLSKSIANITTFTLSYWMKRCGSGRDDTFVTENSTGFFYYVHTDGSIRINDNTANRFISNGLYRDPSAWYHVVINNNGSTFNLYVNGVLDKSASVSLALYSGTALIGRDRVSSPSAHANFYLADIHFIDGQALDPTSFTEVSATTGRLEPIDYTGSFGTNGFHLPFSNNSTAAALGTDTSGNGNTWTVNNISVTPGGSTAVTVPATNAPPSVEYLVIGGGGGGGATHGGGGGAGGYRSSVSGESSGGGASAESPLSVTAGASYSVTVGTGGSGGSASDGIYVGSAGTNSVFGSITSNGGAGAGGGATGQNATSGGGSGGGAGNRGGASNGTANQGFNGGTGTTSLTGEPAGGGGGAGSNGSNGASGQAGNGGSGVFSSITGTSIGRAGGGGGAISGGGNNPGSATSGGGNGGNPTATAGTANTGGGGGGGGSGTAGQPGGSGVVIIRYANTYSDLSVGGGLTYTLTNTGGYKIYTFTASSTPAQAAGNDSLVDTPTSYGTDTGAGGEVRGNYCTWNPLDSNASTLSNGNLELAGNGSARLGKVGTIGITSGKWYWEVVYTSTGGSEGVIGIVNQPVSNPLATSNAWVYYVDGRKANGSLVSYGASWAPGDVMGVALDLDNGTLVFYKNNVSQGTAFSGLSGTFFPYAASYHTYEVAIANFGQRPFAYAAPSGFKALCDTNLPAPVVAKPNEVMDVITYSGNGGTTSLTTSFSPDMVWIKSRSAAYYHRIFDQIRGAQQELYPNATDAEATATGGSNSFTSSGFNVASDYANTSGQSFVAWAWDAGSSTVTNTQGSISSQVRANASAGFSIVTYTGNGTSGATVGHGLGIAPGLIICKTRSVSDNWVVWHSSLGAGGYLILDLTNASATGLWNNTLPSSSVFSLGSGNPNTNTRTYVAYCFAPVAGYSSFGSYTGNGSTDGPFVYTGFRPRFVLIKGSSFASNWNMYDAARDSFNITDKTLRSNLSNAELNSVGAGEFALILDLVSNGFKIRSTGSDNNSNGGSFIYAAFAESPFAYARAR